MAQTQMQQAPMNKQLMPPAQQPMNANPVTSPIPTEKNGGKWWIWLIVVLILVGVGVYFWLM